MTKKKETKSTKDQPSDKPTVLKSDGAHLEEDEGNALSPKPNELPKGKEEKLAKIKEGVQIPSKPTQPLKKEAKKIVVVALMTDKEMAAQEGKYFEDDEKKYTIYDEDVDIYAKETPDGEERLIGKLRKNVLAKDKVELGWENFYITAAPSRNRGAAAGPINVKSKYWLKRKPTEISKWSARYIIDGKVSKMKVNNNVFSSVLGYFESTPFMKLPCRLTSYTQKYFNYYKNGIPFIEELDKAFKTLIPDRHKVQYQAAHSKPLYQIADTAFSSLTVNRNFRTALHKDAGDFPQGYGNLSVIERGKYHGGHTLFPRFGIGFNIRTGDFLAMDVHEWHCNTAMYETEEDKAFNKRLPRIHLDNPETGTQGSDKPYTRISFVCYLRLKLKNCKEAETRKYYKDIDYNSSRGSTERQFTRKKKREEEQE
jgi:hypothetical protein